MYLRNICFAIFMVFLLVQVPRHAEAQTTTSVNALVLYDAPPSSEYEKMGLSYAIMLRNLLGHFDGNVKMMRIQDYVPGTMNSYATTFYLGSYYDNAVPAAFLADIQSNAGQPVPKTVVWFKYNLWKLAWDPAYNFTAIYGFSLVDVKGLNQAPSPTNPAPGFYDTVIYKNKNMVKYYSYDSNSGTINADPDIGAVQIVNTALAQTVVPVKNSVTGEQLPYVVRGGRGAHFWYFADLPLSYIGPRDRYLVLADLLHDIVGIQHAENHQAMVRLEDVSALVNVTAMKTLTNYLYQQKIPFAIATIPFYVDPLGVYNDGVPEQVPLSQATNLKTSLNYALARGAEIVMHGYTHQYSNKRNKYTGVSGDDYEFWDIVANAPVAEDSVAWASGRLKSGLAELKNNGYTPFAWEAPHYQSSPKSIMAVPPLFNTTYQRVVYYTSDNPQLGGGSGKDFAVGQVFPYVIKKDYYGQRILPENLGNIEYDISAIDPSSNFNYTWQDLYTNAQYALTVRDGVASFFFHPFWLEPAVGTPGFSDFKSLVSGITKLGFKWVAPRLVN